VVAGCHGVLPKKTANIWCADAGTVARFLFAICAASPGKYHFDGSARLRQRPMQGLIESVCSQGASIEPHMALNLPLTVRGSQGFQGGTLEVDASASGQFVSALLLAAPFARTPLTINSHDVVSRPFVDMTCAMMAEFGVKVKRLHQERYLIPVPQRYVARDYVVEPDLTTAACFFAAAVVTGGEVTIQPINLNRTRQGDARFLNILQKMGCEVSEKATGLSVRAPATLRGVSVDMRDCSDTFMAVAAIAPFATTPTTITNVGHTRLQESDRISAMCNGLRSLGVNVEEGHDWLRIQPGIPTAGGTIDAHRDHRIAMAFSVIGLRVGVTILGAECVSKTCPEFFTLWAKLYSQSLPSQS
jgi:3-phosphoshikimate 1-carboxyvinyltransferase